MTVSQFIALLKEMPQDAQVVVPGADHSFRRAPPVIGTETAVQAAGSLYEYDGDDSDMNLEEVKLVKVVVIGR